MSQLPTDILLLISSLLAPRDKLECMTVCRQWHDIILKHSLFHVIYIFSHPQLNKLIDRAKRDRDLGESVEKIRMDFEIGGYFDRVLFAELFPNLRVFETLDVDFYNLGYFYTSHQPHPWCKRIERIKESYSDIYTTTVLESGLCKNLIYISVAGKEENHSKKLIQALVNAPALKELHLRNYHITLQDLEMIHQNLPLLDSLQLSEGSISCTPFPSTIEPATSMKRLSSMIFDDYDLETDKGAANYILYCRYISQKYTHLEQLTIELEDYFEDSEQKIEHSTIITSYMKTLAPTLKNLKVNFISDEVDDDNINRDFRFSMLDECGCQINKIELGYRLQCDILKQFAMSTQVQYIQSITLGYIEYKHRKGIWFDWLSRFKLLKELSLGFAIYDDRKRKLDLGRLLGALNEISLETLALSNIKLVINSNTTHILPTIKNLTLKAVKLEKGVDYAISQVFPNLKRLTAQRGFNHGESLMLPTSNLFHLDVLNLGIDKLSHVLVKTLDDNQQRLYTVPRRFFFSSPDANDFNQELYPLPSVPSVPYDKSLPIPDMTIICKSLSTVFMMNCKPFFMH